MENGLKLYLRQSLSKHPIFGHFVLVIILYTFLYQIGEIKQIPNNINLIQWDAGIYQDIKNDGYRLDIEGNSGNAGFFPFFPLLWRFLGLSPIGIAIIKPGIPHKNPQNISITNTAITLILIASPGSQAQYEGQFPTISRVVIVKS